MKRNIIETKRCEYYKKNRKEIGGFLSHLELLLNLVQLFFFIWILTLISKRNMIKKLKKFKWKTKKIYNMKRTIYKSPTENKKCSAKKRSYFWQFY